MFGPERFALRPDRGEVFAWLQCGEALPCRAAFEAEWGAATAALRESMLPCAAVWREGALMTVFVTLGAAAEERITALFREEAYVRGSLLNTMCDEMLFQMDEQMAALLQEMLAGEGLYIEKRLEPQVDLSPAELIGRFAPLRSALPFARVSEAGTLSPTKSMMYCLTLSGHRCEQHALHDCARCRQKDCLYRDPKTRPAE